jgi:hypothetical protein
MNKISAYTLLNTVCTKIINITQLAEALSKLIDEYDPFEGKTVLDIVTMLETGTRPLDKWEKSVENYTKSSNAVAILQESYIKNKWDLLVSLKHEYVEAPFEKPNL